MISARLLILFLAVACGAMDSHAQSTATITQYATRMYQTANATATGYKNTKSEACQASYDGSVAYLTSTAPAQAPYTGSISANDPACSYTITQSNGAVLTASGYTYTTQVNSSASMGCPAAGTVAVRNFTMGYSNSPNDGTDITGLTIPSGNAQCVSGGGAACTGTPGAIKMVWASTEPNAQGLYRVSADFDVTFTGAACTQSNTEKLSTDASATAATCPGTYGTVGGKPVCLPSSLATRNTVAAIAGKTATAGNPPAGSNGELPYSGRTPTSGTNNNDGSPAKSTDGKSVGTVGSGVSATLGATGASSTSGSTDPQSTDCDKKPNSVGCLDFGSVDAPTLPHQDSGFSSITAVSFASSATCPAPESVTVMGHVYAFSFQPICNTAQTYIQPVILIMAAGLAAWVFASGFKV